MVYGHAIYGIYQIYLLSKRFIHSRNGIDVFTLRKKFEGRCVKVIYVFLAFFWTLKTRSHFSNPKIIFQFCFAERGTEHGCVIMRIAGRVQPRFTAHVTLIQ